jgi:hypothetical protein
MIPPQQPQQQMTAERATELVDRQMQWIDQYNQHLLLTVQALQRLHAAFDGKLSR